MTKTLSATGPFLIALAGGSGTGKTTVARALADLTGAVGLLSQDDYYRPRPDGIAHDAYNYDHPDAIEWPLLHGHLDELRSGRGIVCPRYAHDGVRRADGRAVRPHPVIVVEGILVLADPGIAERAHLRVHLDLDLETQLARRIARDAGERGYPEAEVRRMWERFVLPMQKAFVEPARSQADLILGPAEARVQAARIAAMIPDRHLPVEAAD